MVSLREELWTQLCPEPALCPWPVGSATFPHADWFPRAGWQHLVRKSYRPRGRLDLILGTFNQRGKQRSWFIVITFLIFLRGPWLLCLPAHRPYNCSGIWSSFISVLIHVHVDWGLPERMKYFLLAAAIFQVLVTYFFFPGAGSSITQRCFATEEQMHFSEPQPPPLSLSQSQAIRKGLGKQPAPVKTRHLGSRWAAFCTPWGPDTPQDACEACSWNVWVSVCLPSLWGGEEGFSKLHALCLGNPAEPPS